MLYRPVAVSGAVGASFGYGPNLGSNSRFSSIFGDPVINASGEIAFIASFSGSNAGGGVWTNAGGTLHLVARDGTSALGPNVGAGVTFKAAGFISERVLLNDAGEVAFLASLQGTGVTTANDRGIWTSTGGQLAAIARIGSQGPGPNVEAGKYFIKLGLPHLNNAGKIAFAASLNGATDVYGVWSNRSGVLAPVARDGSSGPGPNLGPGIEFDSDIGFTMAGFNDAGQVAFHSLLSPSGAGIWVNSGTNSIVARTGGPVSGPNPGPGTVYESVGHDIPKLNAAGAVVLAGRVSGPGINTTNDTGIWSNAGGSWNAIAREGAAGPGPNLGANIYFDQILTQYPAFLEVFPSSVVINSAGRVAFDAVLTGAGVTSANNSGLWTNPNGVLTAIARTGSVELGPQLPFGETFASFGNYGMNTRGDVVFTAKLAGENVSVLDDAGIWMWSNGALTKIVRTGDVLDLDPSPTAQNMQTVREIFFLGSGGEDGKQAAINDRGTIVYRLKFESNETGIFTAQPLLLGDFNLDGIVSLADVHSMLKALTDLKAYQTKYNLSDSDLRAVGDINQDYNPSTRGGFTNRDIQPFLNLLQNMGPPNPVPEPAGIALAAFGFAIVGAVSRRRNSV